MVRPLQTIGPHLPHNQSISAPVKAATTIEEKGGVRTFYKNFLLIYFFNRNIAIYKST